MCIRDRDGGRGFGQRLPQQRGVVGGINQGEHRVAGLQKLDGNRVRFARGAVAVAAAGQDQHRRAGVRLMAERMKQVSKQR